MKKLDALPEYVRKQVLHELTIGKACETLKDPEIVADRQTWGIYEDVPIFNPYKTIFASSWAQPESLSEKGKAEQIKKQRVELNFLDRMEIMQMQEAKQSKGERPYPQYSEGEPAIYQCGDMFELGIVESACGGDEYFINCHTGETAARTHARNLHKIANGYAFLDRRETRLMCLRWSSSIRPAANLPQSIPSEDGQRRSGNGVETDCSFDRWMNAKNGRTRGGMRRE